ncbi:DNA repair protein RecN [Kaarinaea lacus]
MLSEIHIRNFAIVESLTIELNNGMTVLTGETGAGKSILLDALNLALGGRADSGTIRSGSKRAEISAMFDLNAKPNILAWLKENDLDDDSNCLIRRTVNSDGRSKGYVNGYAVPMQSLRELGDLLVDIHGQHAHQSLLKKDNQRQIVDDFAEHNHLLEQVHQTYRHWRSLKKQQHDLAKSKEEREARIDLLTYQTKELEELNLTVEEIETVESDYAKLAHANQIREGIEQIIFNLEENESSSVVRLVGQAHNQLEDLKRYDDKLAASAELLNDIHIQLSEGISELRHYLSDLDIDPKQLEWLNERLGALHDLSRKHHVDAKELPQLLTTLSTELANLLSQQDHSENLDQEIETAEAAYLDSATKLSASRRQQAEVLQQRVSKIMQQLGMKHGQFNVAFESLEEFSAHGLERLEFMVSMNPGQPSKPMSKVASGGELSRISLALQVIIANKGRIPTLIFDEVDVGIGGGIAEIVGLKLRELSHNRQVLCITHQPQVAALAHNHLHVSKSSSKDTTQTEVKPLNEEQRQNEIARMLGGLEITQQTLSHAKEMIDRSKSEPISS